MNTHMTRRAFLKLAAILAAWLALPIRCARAAQQGKTYPLTYPYTYRVEDEPTRPEEKPFKLWLPGVTR